MKHNTILGNFSAKMPNVVVQESVAVTVTKKKNLCFAFISTDNNNVTVTKVSGYSATKEVDMLLK